MIARGCAAPYRPIMDMGARAPASIFTSPPHIRKPYTMIFVSLLIIRSLFPDLHFVPPNGRLHWYGCRRSDRRRNVR